jgi:3D-(3,5/4)-trihydroxycyclohexane-1,2-dione acylhydrolase (decyclizing)
VETIRLTTAQAIVRWLVNQYTVIDGTEQPLFAGVSAIFGHGNVTCLGEALEPVRDLLPTWHGHNEQAMALTGVAFAKAKRRRQIMIATSSIGPGCTNMVTAAAVAHANRLPLLLLSGDTFLHRIVDPVLQQIEQFDDPTITACDTLKPVTRYWDRITKPEQIVRSLPQALAVMLDPADCGPASSRSRRTCRPRRSTIRRCSSTGACTTSDDRAPTAATSTSPQRCWARPRSR